jgi:hypothetical protein
MNSNSVINQGGIIPSMIPSMTSTYNDWEQQLQRQRQQRRRQPQTQHSQTSTTTTTTTTLMEPAIWKLAVAGSLATLISDVSMHPLDCIKTLQQTEEGMGLSMMSAANVIYYTTSNTILHEQQWGGGSFAGFFKGMFTWGIFDAIGGALKFSTYEGLKRSVLQWQQSQQQQQQQQYRSTATTSIPLDEQLMDISSTSTSTSLSSSPDEVAKTILFALAGISFVVSSVITVPGELLKQHLQMGHYIGCLDALGSIVNAHGVAGLYAGYDGVLLRDVPYTAMELGLYDLFKSLYLSYQQQRYQEKQDDTLQTVERMMIAGLTGGIAGLLTTPLDTVKTKLMVDMDFAGMSFWDAALTTVENHGPEALFCGALARVAWLVPVTAIYLPTYDFIKNELSKSSSSSSSSSSGSSISSVNNLIHQGGTKKTVVVRDAQANISP